MPSPGLHWDCKGLDLSTRPSRKRHCRKALTLRHILALNKESQINSSLFMMDAFLPEPTVEQFTWTDY